MQLDSDMVEILCGEAIAVGQRLQIICNRLLKEVPDRSTPLHHAIDHLKLDLSYIKWALEEAKRGKDSP